MLKTNYFFLLFSAEQEDGWIIIQRRVDASVSFERSWDEYVAGFGDVAGNFWLGLEEMHYLTTTCPMRVQIDVKLFNNASVSIPYEEFRVEDAASEYLLIVASYNSGFDPLYNSFTTNSGSKFSTYDRNNNDADYNCAQRYRAGWWFDSCTLVNLNGVYGVSGPPSMHMRYISDDNYEPIRAVTMKIKVSDLRR